MKKKISYDLKFIIGVMFGYINRHDKNLYPSTNSEAKEDYEMSILYYKKDGGVLRFNNINPKTKYKAEGGLGTDRFERNKLSANYLQKTYPDLITIFHRNNGMTEVKLARRPRIE
jgi:asparagine N-glycosylation enzyme membrane subunit Stt3